MTDSVAIWWIRRDLRLHDNLALYRALERFHVVIPVFIQDPALMHAHQAAPQRQAFLWACLSSLDRQLQKRGSCLTLRSGNPLQALKVLLEETGAQQIFAEADVSPYARKRDAAVKASLPLELVGGPTVHSPEAVLKKGGSPYTVYTPYMRAWKETRLPGWKDLIAAPDKIDTPFTPISDPFPAIAYQHNSGFPPGEDAAMERLNRFTSGENPPIYTYLDKRDRMGEEGTSRLSPYLRLGLISTRHAVLSALDAAQRAPGTAQRQAAETWLNELVWREFYASILYHFPRVLKHSFRPEYQHILWRDDAHDFAAWQRGQTGYPVVDAAIRELLASGWMHNRARMIAASFLVKNLLINWQWGERWFMQHLLDGDPAANNGGWQWTAGTGTDAAPYFRIFNPVLQSKKFDPEGIYLRRWVPELQHVPNTYIHTPWEMPLELQKKTGCVIGKTYPEPIVDLATSRQRTLAAYAQAKERFTNQN